MCTISLFQILSQNENLPQAGVIFYKQITDAFSQSDKVVVNMENVTALPSIFLNVSIGKIIENFGIEKLRNDISFAKITKAQALRLQDYLKKFNSPQNI